MPLPPSGLHLICPGQDADLRSTVSAAHDLDFRVNHLFGNRTRGVRSLENLPLAESRASPGPGGLLQRHYGDRDCRQLGQLGRAASADVRA